MSAELILALDMLCEELRVLKEYVDTIESSARSCPECNGPVDERGRCSAQCNARRLV